MDATEAFSIQSFCAAHSISRTLFYRLVERGEGPKTFKVGDRTLISREAAAEWRAELTAARKALHPAHQAQGNPTEPSAA